MKEKRNIQWSFKNTLEEMQQCQGNHRRTSIKKVFPADFMQMLEDQVTQFEGMVKIDGKKPWEQFHWQRKNTSFLFFKRQHLFRTKPSKVHSNQLSNTRNTPRV